MPDWQEIEVTDFEELSFEQAFRQLAARAHARVTSTFDEDNNNFYLVEFRDFQGNRLSIRGDNLEQITTTALIRVLFMGNVADA